jgi:hypothetical protein
VVQLLLLEIAFGGRGQSVSTLQPAVVAWPLFQEVPSIPLQNLPLYMTLVSQDIGFEQ